MLIQHCFYSSLIDNTAPNISQIGFIQNYTFSRDFFFNDKFRTFRKDFAIDPIDFLLLFKVDSQKLNKKRKKIISFYFTKHDKT